MVNFYSVDYTLWKKYCRLVQRIVFKFFLLNLLIPITGFSQASKVDSLVSLLQKERDANQRILLLHQLHQHTFQDAPDVSLSYAQESTNLSEKERNSKLLSKSYQQQGMSLIMLNMVDSAIFMLEKSIQIANESNNLANEASAIRTLGTAYWYKNDLPKTIELYTQSLKIFDELKDDQQRATTIANIGTAYYVLGDFSKSVDYYSKALEIIDSVKYPSEVSSYMNDIGTIYKEWGNRSKALEFFLGSLAINERIENKRLMAANIDNIGSIYLEDNNLGMALDYYRRGLQIEREIDNINGMASAYISISSVQMLLGQVDSSLIYLQNALKCYNHVDDKLGLANTYSKFGEAYALKGQITRSVNYYAESVEISRSIGDEKGLAYALGGIAKSYYSAGENKKALEALNESIELAKKGNFVNLLMNNYQLLAKLYKRIGNPNEANTALEKFIEVRDTVLKIEKQKQASELLARFESDKKEDRIRFLNQQNELNQTQLARQRAVTSTVVILLLVTGLGIFLLYRRYREKQRVNTLLNTKNKEIEEKQLEIEVQNEKLEIQAEKLRELDEVKSRFFTNISHEFRTPLTLIVGPTERLIEKTNDTQTSADLKMILRNAKNLLGLINQLLEISRIEKGAIKLNLTRGDISKELAIICEMFSSYASDKGISIEFLSYGSDFTGYFDREKIERILFNLISNALKNTEKGKITISLNRAEVPEWIRITVADTGVGIEKEKISYIFDRFYMASDEAGKVGSGIGLAFTHELIKVYKGKISVESELGKGTTFTLELPVSKDAFGENEFTIVDGSDVSQKVVESDTDDFVSESHDKEISLAKKGAQTILLVEDHDELRKFVGANLSDTYNLLEAENGRIGIEMALNHLPDLIITDVMMPEVDGIELSKTLKSNENTSHIPIIMLTARASEQSRIEGLETQVDDYLTKPFSIKELALRIRNILAIRAKLREKYNRSITVSPSEITTNSVDEQFLARILKVVEENMGDPDFSVETLCEKAGVSRATLHKKLTSLVDQSATEFVNSIRVKRAAQLIKQKAGNISEIAFDVGFNNLSYFTKVFKKYIGVNPSEMMG